MPDEIVLPAGTEYVATADIPELITRVLHADAPEPPLKAERDHRQAIVAAIRGGGLKVVAPDTRLATDEYHPNSQVSVEELRRYVAQFKIVVLMGSAVAFSEDDRHRFVNAQYWSERDLLALCLGVPIYADRADIAPEDERNNVRERISHAIRSGDLPAERDPTSDQGAAAVYGGMWRIEPARAVRWALGQFPKFPEWLARSQLRQIYAMQEAEKQAAGRYTLREAAQAIANAGERFEAMEKRLCCAAEAGDLSMYGPGELARYQYLNGKRARPEYEETYWSDLNKWLAKHEPRISYRFPIPKRAPDGPLTELSRLPEEQPKYDAQYIAAWWEGEVDASTVWEAESVTAQQAAMALCGFNPYMASPSEAEQVTKPDETTPDDYKRLMFVFEAKERAEPKHRKLAEWLGIARARAVKYHSWIDTWLAATGKDAPSVSVSPAEGSLPSTGTTHRMNTRVHPLRAVMDAAKAAAVSSTDYHSVWAALVRLAEADSRPAPLLGYVEGEGVKYQTDKDIKFFTKDALRKQMNPNAR